MAIAGAIGTGLIIGSGTALRNGGPGSMLIGYVLMGFIVYIVMVALGEMGAWLPHKKSFSGYASRFVDPAFGYVMFCTTFAAASLSVGHLQLSQRACLTDNNAGQQLCHGVELLL